MDWFRWIHSFTEVRQTRTIAGEIAGRCHARAWERVRQRALNMTAAEARGYIRARSAAVLATELNVALGSHPELEPQAVPKLQVEAMHELVRLIEQTLAAARTSSQSRPRRAA